MNKSMMIGSVIGAIVVTAGGAFAGYKAIATGHEATVVSVKELKRRSGHRGRNVTTSR